MHELDLDGVRVARTPVRTGNIAPIVAQYGGGGSENGFAVYNATEVVGYRWITSTRSCRRSSAGP